MRKYIKNRHTVDFRILLTQVKIKIKRKFRWSIFQHFIYPVDMFIHMITPWQAFEFHRGIQGGITKWALVFTTLSVRHFQGINSYETHINIMYPILACSPSIGYTILYCTKHLSFINLRAAKVILLKGDWKENLMKLITALL